MGRFGRGDNTTRPWARCHAAVVHSSKLCKASSKTAQVCSVVCQQPSSTVTNASDNKPRNVYYKSWLLHIAERYHNTLTLPAPPQTGGPLSYPYGVTRNFDSMRALVSSLAMLVYITDGLAIETQEILASATPTLTTRIGRTGWRPLIASPASLETETQCATSETPSGYSAAQIYDLVEGSRWYVKLTSFE